jgi:uncharacterized RDD family membrane protein YckC
MACFVYEGLILFGIGLIPGLVGAVIAAQTPGRHPWQGDLASRLFAFAVYGVYFIGFWSMRGQTLPMQTWHLQVETAEGAPLSPARALLRYFACWIWIAPPALLASALHWTPWQSIGAVGAWIVAYALLSRLHPQRQFWHDAACRTRLVDRRPAARQA